MTMTYNVFGYKHKDKFFYICHSPVIDANNLDLVEQQTMAAITFHMIKHNPLPDTFHLATRSVSEQTLLAEFPDDIVDARADAVISIADVEASIDEFFN